MGKFVLRVHPVKKSDSVVNHTTECRGCIYKVVYKCEVFLGILLEVREGQCLVQCLKLPFAIHELQELESDGMQFFMTLYTAMMAINPL